MIPLSQQSRSATQKVRDFLSFPLRAFIMFGGIDRWGLTSLASERYDYVARRVIGYCLDVGCGPYNRFITVFLHGYGCGIDVFPYEGLFHEHLLEDPTRFPFDDGQFDSATFIASLNHIPTSLRDAELAEAYRCLRAGGNIVVTSPNPFASILVHRVVHTYDRLFGTTYDIDTQRGMHVEETYYVTDREIHERLARAGFMRITKKYFRTQWCFNHLFIGWK